MSLPNRMRKRKLEDRALEARLRVRKHDPTAEAFGNVVYSPDDIKKLEYEKLKHVQAHFRRKRWLNDE